MRTEDAAEEALAAERKEAVWDAYLADEEDQHDERDEDDEDDPDDAIAEEIRQLRDEDDPERPHSRPEDEEGEVGWNKRIWREATAADKKKVRALQPESLPATPCYVLLAARAGFFEAIRKRHKALDTVRCEDPGRVRRELDGLLSEQSHIKAWIAENRPELVGYEFTRMLSEDRKTAKIALSELDAEYAAAGQDDEEAQDDTDEDEDDEDQGEAAAPPAAKKGKKKVTPKGGGTLDVPAAYYTKEYKRRTVVVPEWVRFLIDKRLHDLDKPMQAYKGVGNLHEVMSQLLYWLEPVDDEGTPRAGEKNRLHHSGAWWVVRRLAGLAKQTGLPRSAVNSATKRLEELGLAQTFCDAERKRTYIRFRAESFAGEVEAWAASHKKKGGKWEAKEKASKKAWSKKTP